MVHIVDAGVMPYRPAWDMQLSLHDQVLAGVHADGALMLVEHPPVVTIGRRPDAEKHLLVPRKLLEARGVEVVETDRGGDITFHGPGQLVAYPIIPLNHYGFNLHSYMRFLEEVVIRTLGRFAVEAFRDPPPCAATGVWVRGETQNAKLETQNGAACGTAIPATAKICALGIKVRKWVTFHGIALNVTTDLSYFQLINPCGLSRPVASMQKLLADKTPPMGEVKRAFGEVMTTLLPAPKSSGVELPLQ